MESWQAGMQLLRVGRWAEGWPLYENRPVEMGGRASGKPTLPFPEWTGEPIRSLLVLPEQGFGDQIMFGRYAAALQQRGVQVHVMCHPRLARLFSGLGFEVISAQGRVALPACDAWALAPSLPARLGATPQTIPPPLALKGAGDGRGGVGLAWRCKPAPHPERALPEAIARTLLERLGARSLEPEDTGAQDFQDSADLIAGLDLVVTIDTAVAHLAGSMGKPTWILLPQPADWRWLEDPATTPWYPSAALYRQSRPADWSDVIERVVADLAAGGPARD